MKEYSLREIFDLPEGTEFINADAHFEVLNGILYSWFNTSKDKQSVRLTKMYVNMKFTRVEHAVSFMEAVNSGLEGKLIKVQHHSLNDQWNNVYLSIDKIFWMLSKSVCHLIPLIIKEGRWFIQDESEVDE